MGLKQKQYNKLVNKSDYVPTKKKGSKMKNVKTLYNGVEYDSKKEADRAFQLDCLKREGKVLHWFGQVVFPYTEKTVKIVSIDKRKIKCKGIDNEFEFTDILPVKNEYSYEHSSKRSYILDFLVLWADGKRTYEDVKGRKWGEAWEVYLEKKKVMKELYGIELVEK